MGDQLIIKVALQQVISTASIYFHILCNGRRIFMKYNEGKSYLLRNYSGVNHVYNEIIEEQIMFIMKL